MDLFAQFFAWLNGQLADYIGSHVAAVAAAIEPAAVTLAVVYVMMWGFMHLTGRIEEPIWEGVKRILTMALILGIGIELWAYNELIVNAFFTAPDQLARAIVGAPTTVSVVDQVWKSGNLVAEQLLSKGGLLNGDLGYYLAGWSVYLLVGLAAVYTAFLLALSKIALALILALGPIFIALLFFDTTKRFFEAWIAQLANYALITILSLLAAALLLHVLDRYAADAAAAGSGITIAASARVCVIAILVFLVMRQVMPIASALASGIALSSFGVISGAVNWGLGAGKRTGYEGMRGVMDGWKGEPRSRWDSLRRGAGNRVGAGARSALNRVGGTRTGGTLVPREQAMPRPRSW